MRKFKSCRPRTLPFRLLVPVAGALLFTAAFTPRANAFVVSYFNFEDSHFLPTPVFIDPVPDKTVAAGGDNAGGGIEATTTNPTFGAGHQPFLTPGLTVNVTPNDADTAAPQFGIAYNKIQSSNATISFGVNLTFYQGLSLSFATDNNGNGFGTVALTWTGAGGSVPSQAMPTTPGQTVTFTLPPDLNGDGMTAKFVTFTLTFSNGHSNGNDLQTVIDNIRLDTTTIIPEPSTVAGGLLGVIGLCWFQRRRIRLILLRGGFRGLRRV